VNNLEELLNLSKEIDTATKFHRFGERYNELLSNDKGGQQSVDEEHNNASNVQSPIRYTTHSKPLPSSSPIDNYNLCRSLERKGVRPT